MLQTAYFVPVFQEPNISLVCAPMPAEDFPDRVWTPCNQCFLHPGSTGNGPFLMVHSPLITLFYWCISGKSPKASAIFMHCLFNSFLKRTSCYGCITFNMSPRFEVSKQKSPILPVHIYKPPLVYYLTRHLSSCFICHFASAERAFPFFIIPKPYL